MANRCTCRFLIAGLALVPAVAPARAQDSIRVAYQFWPEIDVYARLSSQARLYFIGTPVQEVEDGRVGRITDLQVGAFVEVGLMPFNPRRAARARLDGNNRMRYLRLRSGIEHVSPPGDPEGEWRSVTELRPRLPLPADILVELRGRLELRWIDGDFSVRNRLRLWLEREFHIGRVTLVPYGSAEPFWDSRYDAITRVRYQLGTVVPISERVAPEVNYTRDRDDVEGVVSITHALNVIVTFYF
jgi:hypothetical protein